MPAPLAATLAMPMRIDGLSSHLHQAGYRDGVTVGEVVNARAGRRSVREALSKADAAGMRYQVEDEIGRGGMGLVLRAIDRDLRREVAVKYLLDHADSRKTARFVEEAQITGQLEHPNIVSVHELGVDAQKRLFFTMKMVKGRSLAGVLDALRKKSRETEKEYTLGRLLTILVNVCHALAYAHSRGVIHRDLKPANIMLGDFGEVYVMDWGLAKVLGAESAAASHKSSVPTSATVLTDRMEDSDLTQDGSIMGTPAYMPPEQAEGRIGDIDQRSDVYALGAMLYEMLTLQTPISSEGGVASMLQRVSKGEIVPPDKIRRVPAEMVAVAMKALAKNAVDRYPNVEALRQDIERFQEGRSVSAKEDTKREMIWKFVKRNKAFSAATAVGLVVVLYCLVLISKAWWETGKAYADYKREHEELEQRTRDAVPALVKAGRLSAIQREFKNAMDQVDLALAYDSNDSEARLLKGQLLILDKKFDKAALELEKAQRQNPDDVHIRQLVELCGRPRPDDVANLLAIAQVFEQQKALALADSLLTLHGRSSFEARSKLLEMYRQRIEAAWPGAGAGLTMDATGIYSFDCYMNQQVSNLAPLEGMPLTRLKIAACPVRDLSPLQGMPLVFLDAHATGIHDLSPLKGMRLASLTINNTPVADLSPLRGMALTELGMGRNQVKDLTPLQGMPLTSLNLDRCEEVRDLTPLREMDLTDLAITPRIVSNGVEVFRHMKNLKTIHVTDNGISQVLSAVEFWKKYDAGEFNK